MKPIANPAPRRGAFSLVEVVIALGVLAVVVTGALAMLVPVLRGSRESLDRRTASRVVPAVEREMRDYVRANFSDFDAFAASTATPIRFVASAEGGVVERETVAVLAAESQYHLIEVSRAASPAFSPGQGYVALGMRVSWPYRGGAVAEGERSVLTTVLVVTP